MKAELDTNPDETGSNVSEKAMEGINLTRDECHGAWNYQNLPLHKSPIRLSYFFALP